MKSVVVVIVVVLYLRGRLKIYAIRKRKFSAKGAGVVNPQTRSVTILPHPLSISVKIENFPEILMSSPSCIYFEGLHIHVIYQCFQSTFFVI